MRKRILRADIIGVDTEEEIVANLTDVAFDSPYEVTVNDGGVQFTQGVGCFVHGAGMIRKISFFEVIEITQPILSPRFRYCV